MAFVGMVWISYLCSGICEKNMDSTDKHYAYNEAIRQKLDHEHSVIKSRTDWHHIIQIAMFTGFYTIMNSEFPLHLINYILPILGIIYALSALYSIWVSEKARACIFMHWNRYLNKNGLKWEDFPPVSGDPIPHIKNCRTDLAIFIDMNLKPLDYPKAKYLSKWFMLYRFIPVVLL
jgi:hypothetical protein